MSIIQKSQKSLEYDRILTELCKYAKTEQSKKMCLELTPFVKTEDIHEQIVLTREAKDVLVVDNKALKFTPSENKQKYDKQGIWILKGTTPVRYDIELGLSDDNKTQVKNDELQEGDKVIISESGTKKKAQGGGGRPPM